MALVMPEKKSSIAADLRRLIGSSSVKDDDSTLRAYSVDAGIYRIRPLVVVLPNDEEAIDRIARYALKHGIPLTPRSAGTNLTGSAIGPGIILDVSRMNRLLEVNPTEKWARVEPGMVLAELNKQLFRYGLMFGPDPSSGDSCKLGGMVANNSSGPHTLRYGSVKENVLALRVWLQSGGWITAKPHGLNDPALHQLFDMHPPFSNVLEILRNHEDLIQARRPRVSKNSTGYNLFDLVDGFKQELYDLPKLFAGSEGTLGIFGEATIQLVDLPESTGTGLLHFGSLEGMGDAVPHLLSLSPTALEVMDANTLNLIGRSTYGIPGDAAATLLIDFEQAHDPETADKLLALCRRFQLVTDPVLAFDQEKQEQLWKARKALYPTLYRYDPKKKPINFVDDVVVPADRTGALIRYLEHFFQGQEVSVAVFGHIGNGNAHILPLLDVNDQSDFQSMVEGYREIHQTVVERFDGSICGEHGDGRIRAEMVRVMYGEELYDLFVRVKRMFDPAGVLNPGVKISDVPFTQHIDFERLAKPCATCAKCNSVCPVYDVFQSEDMSARGWFEIVTDTDYRYLESKRVVESCLNCKSCRTICPAGVDVSELILQRRAEHPNKTAGRLFALHARPWLFEPMLKWAARTQGLWDRPFPRAWIERLAKPLLRGLAETAGIPRDMELPRLAKNHLRDRYPELCRIQPGGKNSDVAYFHGCAANYFDDGVGDAVIALLCRMGIQPVLPSQRCSGTPIETYGFRELAKEGARENLRHLRGYGTVVTGCASCTLSLKDYPSLFKGESEQKEAQDLAGRVKHISELLWENHQTIIGKENLSSGGSHYPAKVTYHSSCHLRAAGVTQAPRHVLANLPGLEFIEMQDADRCAGGAGTYLVKDYETSQRIFDRKRRAIQESGAGIVATSCPACMIQLKNGLRGQAVVKHIAELVSDVYKSKW